VLNGHVHTNAGLGNNEIAFFFSLSDESRFLLIELMADFEYTAKEKNVLPIT
jgi:hypothetical protein